MSKNDLIPQTAVSTDQDISTSSQVTEAPPIRQQQRASDGFLSSGPRLEGYMPTPPHKRAKKSYIWQVGIRLAVTEVKTGKKFWLCCHCYNNPVPQPLYLVETDSTTPAIRHLQSRHNYDEKGRRHDTSRQKRKRDTEDIRDAVKRLRDEKERPFDTEGWKRAYLRWIVLDNQSLRNATSPALRALLGVDHSEIDALVPTSYATAHRYIVECYVSSKAKVTKALAKARSSISVSFDGWLADNQLDMLGVTAHYLDEQLHVKTVLLGLRPMYGAHSGVAIAEELLTVMRDFKISDRVGYFVADNASNNDAALRQIAKEIDIDPSRQRIRCSAHILNLVAKAILYGTDSDCVADAAKFAPRFDSSESDNALTHIDKVAQPRNDDPASLAVWRKRGALGRCHNLVYHVKGSPRRRRYFESKQREISDSRIYQLVANGGIRWNSDLEMIERALKLKDALQLAEDWNELKAVKELLQPLKDASIRCQTLLSKFEDLKRQPLSLYFLACINLGWKKLNKYYELSDASPAYRLSVFLHLSHKMAWFERNWGERRDWIRAVEETICTSWGDCKRRWPNDVQSPRLPVGERSHEELDEFERFMDPQEDLEMDDLTRWRREPCVRTKEPLQWWRDNHHRFPVLRHLAFEIFACPASSAADERVFSLAGNVLNDARHNTQEELAEAYQGLRSWFAEELI
ncbi:hypothetical protein Q7P35_005181 [Cladosporium inversicolor]